MGTNSKLHVQFDRRHWRDLGSNGETFSDTGYQNTWEVTRAQAGHGGHPRQLHGRHDRCELRLRHAASARQAVPRPDRAGPPRHHKARGTAGATIDFWPATSGRRGSYSYWKVGQYTRFAGVESEQQGNCHFAGEHTSIDFQGYLNGAVERASAPPARSSPTSPSPSRLGSSRGRAAADRDAEGALSRPRRRRTALVRGRRAVPRRLADQPCRRRSSRRLPVRLREQLGLRRDGAALDRSRQDVDAIRRPGPAGSERDEARLDLAPRAGPCRPSRERSGSEASRPCSSGPTTPARPGR